MAFKAFHGLAGICFSSFFHFAFINALFQTHELHLLFPVSLLCCLTPLYLSTFFPLLGMLSNHLTIPTTLFCLNLVSAYPPFKGHLSAVTSMIPSPAFLPILLYWHSLNIFFKCHHYFYFMYMSNFAKLYKFLKARVTFLQFLACSEFPKIHWMTIKILSWRS